MPALTDTCIIVSGASRGLGAVTARLLARRGARVVLAARSAEAISRVASEIQASGGKALAVACDVASFEDMTTLVATAENAFGPVGAFIANAGVIEPIQHLATSDPGAWSMLIDINVKGVYYGTRAVLPGMIARGKGTIVTVGSGAAHSPLEAWSAYCTSKAAALMLTKAAHQETAGKGIVNINLSPGIIRTEMQARIRASGINPVSQIDPDQLGDPAIPAAIIAWLCGPDGAQYAGQDVRAGDPDLRRKAGVTA